MVFKQKILKEEVFKFILSLYLSVIPSIIIALLGLATGEKIEIIAIVWLVLFFPLVLCMILMAFWYLEWFYIFEDRIEVKNIFGNKNTVYFSNVLFVEEATITLTRRGMEKLFYIFNDGRKNNNNFLDINSCYNNKKYNLRIYKTDELENFITNSTTLQIKSGL